MNIHKKQLRELEKKFRKLKQLPFDEFIKALESRQVTIDANKYKTLLEHSKSYDKALELIKDSNESDS